MGSVGEVLPSRDSTRIAKHTFDAAKIGTICLSPKLFSIYFHFFTPKGSLFPKSFVFLQLLSAHDAMMHL